MTSISLVVSLVLNFCQQDAKEVEAVCGVEAALEEAQPGRAEVFPHPPGGTYTVDKPLCRSVNCLHENGCRNVTSIAFSLTAEF